MAESSSIKGSVINELAEDIAKLEASGELSRSAAESSLTAEDREIVEAGILPIHWYDVQFYRRCSELLRDTVGNGSNEYLKKRGFDKGTKLIKAGLYQQMEYATRTQMGEATTSEARFEAYKHDLRLFVTLSGSILNFSKWSVELDPDHDDRYVILVDEASDYPDELAWATEGLIEAMSASHGMFELWRHRRTNRDRITFYMTRSL